MTEKEARALLWELSMNQEENGEEEYCEAINVVLKVLEEVQQYRSIGTVEECRAAVEKQRAMKVTDVHIDEYYCPACGSENNCDDGSVGDKYCPECGQALYI